MASMWTRLTVCSRRGRLGVQLTWMDAKVGDWVVTPRTGKARRDKRPLAQRAVCHRRPRAPRRVSMPIRSQTMRSARGPGQSLVRPVHLRTPPHSRCSMWSARMVGPDATMRPNQIFAVSLPFPVIEGASSASASWIRSPSNVLLTPYGLRTLSPGSPDYHPHYGPGDQATRDGAYHQGTVWPWLLGAFADAHLKVYGDKAEDARPAWAPCTTRGPHRNTASAPSRRFSTLKRILRPERLHRPGLERCRNPARPGTAGIKKCPTVSSGAKEKHDDRSNSVLSYYAILPVFLHSYFYQVFPCPRILKVR